MHKSDKETIVKLHEHLKVYMEKAGDIKIGKVRTSKLLAEIEERYRFLDA